MKKKIFILFACAALSGLLSAATITDDIFNSFEYESFYDATITSSTPSNRPDFRPVDFLFNGDVAGGDNVSAVIFNDVGEGNRIFIEFKTARPVDINVIKLALRTDSWTDGKRSATAWDLYANDTGASFQDSDKVSSGMINPDYIGAYGSHAIVVTDSDLSVTAQYFRLELTQGPGGGIRAVELGGASEAD